MLCLKQPSLSREMSVECQASAVLSDNHTEDLKHTTDAAKIYSFLIYVSRYLTFLNTAGVVQPVII